MPFCSNCGTEMLAESRFCQTSGQGLGTMETRIEDLRYRISPTRIIVMSVLSWSLYYYYWLYITWKHYRDHTGQEAYPVWHALTQSVPIYGLFRVHAHARSFKELMVGSGLPTTITAGGTVVAVLVFSVLSNTELGLSFGEITEDMALALVVIAILSVLIVAGLLLHLQGNINRYWDSVAGYVVPSARIGVGEVILAVLGVLLWADTFATLLSSEYRSLGEFAAVLGRCCIGA